jgi:hypothetical protein
MMPKIMTNAVKIAGVLALCLSLSGCIQQLNRDLAAVNASMASNKPGTMASGGNTSTTQIQLVVPNDDKAKAAVDAALPTIKKVLAIHQCVKTLDGMLALNQFALPGVNLAAGYLGSYPLGYMQYHDKNKCMSIRTIDRFIMPAFNTLTFRTVFFAEDSGEMISLQYEMRKSSDNAQWFLTRSPT